MNVHRIRQPEFMTVFCIGIGITAAGLGCLISIPTGCYAGAVSAVFCLLFSCFTQNRCREIAELSELLEEILHGEGRLFPGENEEGELSILRNQIYKMTVRLREQNEALLRDKKYLRDSLADISHQLRTPLTTLRLLQNRLAKEQMPERERMECLMEQNRLMNRIDWLIASLLKISRLESGTVALQKEAVPFEQLIREAMTELWIPMELREIELVTDIQKDSGFTGDLYWSTEAAANILKNCMEHSPRGGRITVTCRENPICSELEVTDEGNGIAPEDLPHLFERFYRGKDASNVSFGIGLALARMIVGMENGSITAENRKEGGARFMIRFYKGII